MKEIGKLLIASVRRLSSHNPLIVSAALMLTSNGGGVVVVKVMLITVLISVACMFRGRDPQARFPVEGLVLSREVNALAVAAALVATALGKGAGSLGELGGNGSVLRDPVGKGVFAVLDDAAVC